MAGHYDRQCDDCDGTGKVQVVDEHQLTEEQLRAWKADVAEEREYEAMVAAERRAGA
jgi:excinuclease UvrABC ATPase subunit